MPLNARRVALPLLLFIAAGVFLAGLNWGLPSRDSDAFLFGGREPWSGQKILAMTGGWKEDPNVGSDVASNSVQGRDRPVALNDTDAQRAKIAMRYRLYSYQPDEMITFRALSLMKPGRRQLDPQMYQYGGLWVYPVGAMLGAAGKLGLVDVRPDVAWYLDHPDAFGRFYIVARCYSALWGLVGVIAVYGIVARIVGGWVFPSAGALCFMFMPVVVNAAHESKPHLAGAVLMLLAAWAAARFVETGTRRAWMLAGALSGAAVGMVISSAPVMLVLLGMVLLRPMHWRQRMRVLICSGVLAAGVYLLTNPYVGINLLRHRDVLWSNLQNNLANSSAMYHLSAEGSALANGCRLIGAGMSPVLAVAGAAGLVALGLRAVCVRDRMEGDEVRRRATGILLALPATAGAAQFFFFAAGKQAEYARFALLPDIFLAVEAVVGVATFVSGSFSLSVVFGREGREKLKGSRVQGFQSSKVQGLKGSRVHAFEPLNPSTLEPSSAPDPNPLPRVRERGDQTAAASAQIEWNTRIAILAPQGFMSASVMALLVLATAIPGVLYVRGFILDARTETGRMEQARLLRNESEQGARTLVVWVEPAPYCMPPVDLFRWQILLLPEGAGTQEGVRVADVSVRPVDYLTERGWWSSFASTPIGWADKPFEVRSRKSRADDR
ncbi:MAG: hypothetical protein JWL69_215 [Phycisphaerales bacterium]|nr:hypothetical protein [Phycisphaerales bacterium]